MFSSGGLTIIISLITCCEYKRCHLTHSRTIALRENYITSNMLVTPVVQGLKNTHTSDAVFGWQAIIRIFHKYDYRSVQVGRRELLPLNDYYVGLPTNSGASCTDCHRIQGIPHQISCQGSFCPILSCTWSCKPPNFHPPGALGGRFAFGTL